MALLFSNDYLNYPSEKVNEILSVEKDSDLFCVLKKLDNESNEAATWRDIFNGLNHFIKNSPTSVPQLPENLKDSDIKLLEDRYGFDINYVDTVGNNLLLYAQGVVDLPFNGTVLPVSRRDYFKADLGSSAKYLFDYCIDYILGKTENVYLINSVNENLLFRFASINSVGIKAANLEKIIDKYPDFDLDIVNFYGHNLLTNSVARCSPTEVVNLYKTLQVDLLEKNIKGETILHFIHKNQPEGIFLDLFKKAFSELDNPFYKDNEGNTFLETISTAISENKNNKFRPLQWLKVALSEVSSNSYKLNPDTILALRDFFDNQQSATAVFFLENPRMKEIVGFEEAKISFNKRMLECELLNSLGNKDTQTKKAKI